MFVESRALLVRRTDNLAAICEPNVQTMWDLQHLTALLYVTGTALLIYLGLYISILSRGVNDCTLILDL
jgi:hypothetical protein